MCNGLGLFVIGLLEFHKKKYWEAFVRGRGINLLRTNKPYTLNCLEQVKINPQPPFLSGQNLKEI
jgi:hypothetical protein